MFGSFGRLFLLFDVNGIIIIKKVFEKVNDLQWTMYEFNFNIDKYVWFMINVMKLID